jgi:glycine C-acetyltransferase
LPSPREPRLQSQCEWGPRSFPCWQRRLRAGLWENTAYFRGEMETLGFELLPAEHPIVAVMLHDAKVAKEMSERLLEKGVYVIAFSFPVVPKGEARIRVQVNASHSREDLEFAVKCFGEVKAEMEHDQN